MSNHHIADTLKIANKNFTSRLFLGTGKYDSLQQMHDSIIASKTQMVTVAIRKIDLSNKSHHSFHHFLPKDILILPNTAGCFNVNDAIQIAMLAREITKTKFIKLEILSDATTLLPDVVGLLEASKKLISEGFHVLAYTNDDLCIAQKLQDLGVSAVMPLAASIGTGKGVLNPATLKLICKTLTVPVVIDAGLGTASDATIAMELGADAVLINTAIAESQNPVFMAQAMHLATQAGRYAFLSGRMPKKEYGVPSSPPLN